MHGILSDLKCQYSHDYRVLCKTTRANDMAGTPEVNHYGQNINNCRLCELYVCKYIWINIIMYSSRTCNTYYIRVWSRLRSDIKSIISDYAFVWQNRTILYAVVLARVLFEKNRTKKKEGKLCSVYIYIYPLSNNLADTLSFLLAQRCVIILSLINNSAWRWFRELWTLLFMLYRRLALRLNSKLII